jgi:hypothetical protein
MSIRRSRSGLLTEVQKEPAQPVKETKRENNSNIADDQEIECPRCSGECFINSQDFVVGGNEGPKYFQNI